MLSLPPGSASTSSTATGCATAGAVGAGFGAATLALSRGVSAALLGALMRRDDRRVLRALVKRNRHSVFGRCLLAVRLARSQRQLIVSRGQARRHHDELS